jgi:hypothetical protein
METGTIKRIYCNTCKGQTNHELKSTQERKSSDVDFEKDPLNEAGQYEEWTYLFWICRGCETASLQEDHVVYVNGVEQYVTVFYPRRERNSLATKTFLQLNEKLTDIYEEVIKCFNDEAWILCAVGLRALLEGICADKNIAGRSLFDKIQGLDKHLPSNIVESLHSFRFIGNDAAHELQAPLQKDLQVAIEVMQDLLNFLYELDYKARSISLGLVDKNAAVKRPTKEIIRRIIERNPATQQSQKDLYRALFDAGDKGLKISQIATALGMSKEQAYGVLGALGRRINTTTGVEGKPGILLLFELKRYDTNEDSDNWGWALRPEVRSCFATSSFAWLRGDQFSIK